ncbi:hypothetical protein Mgra_00001059, partial [Meloidogyne graminicola]
MENFKDLLRKMIKNKEYDHLKRFQKSLINLIGNTRMEMLIEIYPDCFYREEKREKIFFDLLNEYFNNNTNIIEKWRLKNAINYFIYFDWMEKRQLNGEAEWNFKLIWNEFSNNYLYGEYYLQNIIANFKLIKIEELKKEAEKLYLFTEEYANSNLFKPIYLQTIKECCEYIDNFIRQKRLYEKKEIENNFLNKIKHVWFICVH